MKSVEKLFIEFSKEYESELEQGFFQTELNTFEYFDTNNINDILHVTYLNILMAEFYFEYAYKYFNEYYKTNNSLKILGAVENDPQLRSCVEIIKDILIKIRQFKVDIIILLESVFGNNKVAIQPSNETMLHTVSFGSAYKKPKTAIDMLEFTIRSLVRAEAALSTLDHITSNYFFKYKHIIEKNDTDNCVDHEAIAENLLNCYLELKLNYLIEIKI